jgi:hypothetical protein
VFQHHHLLKIKFNYKIKFPKVIIHYFLLANKLQIMHFLFLKFIRNYHIINVSWFSPH